MEGEKILRNHIIQEKKSWWVGGWKKSPFPKGLEIEPKTEGMRNKKLYQPLFHCNTHLIFSIKTQMEDQK